MPPTIRAVGATSGAGKDKPSTAKVGSSAMALACSERALSRPGIAGERPPCSNSCPTRRATHRVMPTFGHVLPFGFFTRGTSTTASGGRRREALLSPFAAARDAKCPTPSPKSRRATRLCRRRSSVRAPIRAAGCRLAPARRRCAAARKCHPPCFLCCSHACCARTAQFHADAQKLQRRLNKMWAGLLDPMSKFMERWDLVLIGAMIFTAFITPAELAFGIMRDPLVVGYDTLFWFNQIVNLIFWIDITFQFFLPIRARDGRTIRSHRRIAYFYCTGWFSIDVCTQPWLQPQPQLANHRVWPPPPPWLHHSPGRLHRHASTTRLAASAATQAPTLDYPPPPPLILVCSRPLVHPARLGAAHRRARDGRRLRVAHREWQPRPYKSHPSGATPQAPKASAGPPSLKGAQSLPNTRRDDVYHE